MSAMKLNPQRLAEAIAIIQECFDKEAKAAIESRAGIVLAMSDSAYKEELVRCERVNEQNYNSILPSTQNLVASVNEIKEVAEIMAKREIETTKAREAQAQAEVVDAVSSLRPF